MTEPIPMHQRIAGAVWGHLIGDAVGVPYEFQPPDAIGTVEMRGGGVHDQPAGTWSDDGALMLAQLDASLHGGDVESQAQALLSWADEGAYTPNREGRFDIGTATSVALDRLRAGVSPAESGNTGPDDAGNGSLMRILPVALVDIRSPAAVLVQRVHSSSRITHADPRCQVACALYVLVAHRLQTGEPDRDGALSAAIDQLQDIYAHPITGIGPEHARALDALLAHRASVRRGRGYVLDTFWSAWEAFAEADSYRETIERAVGFGHDTDTTAAIAGGLAGISWGVAGIPAAWLQGLRGQELVEPLIRELTSALHD